MTKSSEFVKEKNAPHTWTREQRILLCVLKRWFVALDPGAPGGSRELVATELRDIFCSVFYDEIRSLNPNGKLTTGAITSQFYEMKNYG